MVFLHLGFGHGHRQRFALFHQAVVLCLVFTRGFSIGNTNNMFEWVACVFWFATGVENDIF